MAKGTVVTRIPGEKPKKNSKIVVNSLDIRQIIRTVQDIATWREEIRAAENIYFPRKVKLFDMYFDILLDAHLSAVINKRKTSVLKKEWTFVDKSGKEIPEIMDMIKSPSFNQMCNDILDFRYWGHTLIELEFPAEGGFISHLIPRKHVMQELGLILINQFDMDGLLYREPPYSNFMFEVGQDRDLGLLCKAAQYVIYKRNCLGDYSQYAEIFGQPLRKGTYNPYDEESRLQLKKAMEESGSAPWVIFPDGCNVEFVEAKNASGSGEMYKTLLDYCNTEISKLIVGQTLTTEAGKQGARSLGEVHKEIEDEIEFEDTLLLKNILNFKFKPLLLKRGFPADGEFDNVEDEDMPLKDRIVIDEILNGIIPLDDDYFYNTYGIEKPENYAELKAKMDSDKEAKNNQFLMPPAKEQDPNKAKQQTAKNKQQNSSRFFQIAR